MIHELRVALRKLVRSPLFLATSVLTLALGIGANTAIFSVLEGVLLEPLPYPRSEELVRLSYTAPGLGFDDVPQSAAMHFTILDEADLFDSLGMWSESRVAVTGIGAPEQVRSMMVTQSVLPMLGADAAAGRIFSPEDDAPGAPRTVILSHAYWQRRFGDQEVLGRSLQVDGNPHEIIGVLPAGFRFLDRSPDLFYAGRFDRSEAILGQFNYEAMGRLRPGADLHQAATEITRLLALAADRFPGGITPSMVEEARLAAVIQPLKQAVVGDVSQILWVLLGTVGLVLLIACANVANLFLVRTEARSREISLRLALGASGGRLSWHFLGESLILALLGGALGLGLASGGLALLRSLGPRDLPRLEEIGIDPEVLLFTLTISLLTGLFLGLVPVLRSLRLLRGKGASLTGALQEGGRLASPGRERHRLRAALVVSQVALALVLLVGSGLMLRSFAALRAVDPGFERPQDVLTFRLFIPYGEIEEELEAAQTYEEIGRRVEALPGVGQVAIISALPLSDISGADALEVEGFETPEGQMPPVFRFMFVGGDVFETLGTRMLAGRAIEWSDVHQRRGVAVVSENLARRYWGDPAGALGKRLRTATANDEEHFSMQGTAREIVGVVQDTPQLGISEPPPELVYFPMVMNDFWSSEVFLQRNLAYAVRTRGPVSPSLAEEVRKAVWSVNSNLPLAGVRTLEEIYRRSLARTSFTLLMLGIAAAVALLLGMVGVYGVLSYLVSLRSREIGVRLALGAGQGEVVGMLVRYGLTLIGGGVVVGLLGALALSRLMSQLLYGVEAADPITYAGVALLLAGVALLASFLAARRAAGVDPARALRAE